MEDSITKKPKIEKLANVVSGYFSVTILSISLLTFLGWFLLYGSLEKSLIVAISVIVIACPCALGLATPMATLLGISTAAKKGILFKEASFLETMAKSDILVLDKTGTITKGKPSVVSFEKLKDFDINSLYSLVLTSNHPISRGVLNYLLETCEDLKEVPLNNIKSVEAKGIEAEYTDKKIIGGNLELLKKNGIDFYMESENSLFIFAFGGEVKAVFELKDEIKEDATEAILKIKELGIKTVMLTGDNEKTSLKVAKAIGVDEVYAKLLPQDKFSYVEKLHEKGSIAVMAGDGINDSLALSCSDIAIAMGSGADIAISVSDVVLMDEKPMNLYLAYKISKRSYRIVKENIALSVIYNIIAVPVAVMGFVNPLVAALSMSLSSLLVVGNSFRIRKDR